MTKILMALTAVCLLSSYAVAAPGTPESIDYIGSISINPSQEAKVLANWYSHFGIATEEMNTCPKMAHPCLSYFKVSGSWFFAIHPKKKHAPKKNSGSVEFVFHVTDFDAFLANAAKNGIEPLNTTSSPGEGRVAIFNDPDGNQVSVWGK